MHVDSFVDGMDSFDIFLVENCWNEAEDVAGKIPIMSSICIGGHQPWGHYYICIDYYYCYNYKEKEKEKGKEKEIS